MANPWEMGLKLEDKMPWEMGLAGDGPGQYEGMDILKTTPDGGMVLHHKPTNTITFKGPKGSGFATTDPDFIQQVMDGADPRALAKQDWRSDITEQNLGTARFQKFAEGQPFYGTWLDKAIGVVDPEAEANLKALSSSMEQTRPGESIALRTAGGVVGSIPYAMAAPLMPGAQAISQLPGVQRAVTYGGIGGLTGGLEGFISGAGEGKAREGAIGGTLGGAVGGVAAPLLGQGIESIVKLAKRTDIPNIAAALGISKEAAMVIKTTFAEAGGDLKTALRNIKMAGDRGMIADADTAAAVLLDAAGAAGGKASTIVGSNVRQRAKAEAADLGGYLDQSLSPLPTVGTNAADVTDIATSIARSTAPAREAAYARAYSTPIDYSADTGKAVEEMISRIPPRYLSAAINRANESMQMAGQRNLQIMAEIADDGTVVFREMPNVQQLDEIKKALGKVAFEDKDQFGRPTADAVAALKLYRQLRDTIADAAPGYREAMDIASDKISLDNALDVGEKLLTTKITTRDAARMLQGSTESERNMAKLGVRSYIQEVTDRVKATVASPEVDINQLRKTLSELSSDASKKKLQILLGTKETQTLYKNLERANAALALRAAVAANSKTAIRQRVQQQVDELTDTGVLQTMLQGRPAAATQKGIQALTGATEEYGVEMQKRVFTDIARALSGIQGREAREAVFLINKAIKNQAALDATTYGKIMNILLDNIGPMGTLAGGQYGAEQTRGQ